ncbi:MAG: phage tail tape measure protein [Gammaproteobacteria bacterium]|nr:phage tail tape measure protein [Gammaproteobacteria bacterium]
MADAKYSIAIAALDKFTAPFKSFSGVNKKLNTQLQGQQAELRKLKSAQSDLSGFQRMEQRLSATSVALEQAKLDQAELSQEIKATEKPTKRLTNAFERAKVKTAQLRTEHDIQTSKLNRLDRGLKEAGFDARKFASEQERIEHATKQANAALSVQQGRLRKLSSAQSRIKDNRAARADLRGKVLGTAAIGYVAAQPIRAAINYESAMADVEKVVDFESDAEAQKMGRDILKLSTQMPIAAQGIAEIVGAAGQSGVAKAELMDFAKTAGKMAVAFDVSAEDAGSTMAAWRASMGLSQLQAVALADATNHLSNSMNAEAKEVAGVLKRQGAVAMSAGLNEIQAASLSAALLSGGAGEEVSATALKNITGALVKGDTATSAQQAAWSELGFDSSQLAGDMLDDAPDTMIRVFEAMQEVPAEQVSALVSTLFGDEVKGSVMPLLKNLDNLRDAFKKTSDASKYQGAMEIEYKKRMETTGSQMQMLSHSFERLQINLGTLLLPTLISIMEPIANVTDALANAAEKYPIIGKGIALVGVSLAGLMVGSLALKMVGLTLGQGINYLRLGRAKLSATTQSTARNATLANRALRRMNATMARMSGRRMAMGGVGADLEDADSGRRRRGRRGRLGGAMRGVGRMIRPVGAVLTGAALVSAVGGGGDSKEVGATTGDLIGGLGGAAAGGLAGAALGSVIPGFGTAIGGLIGSIVGGLGGGAAGEWAGIKAARWWDDPADRLPSPEQIKKEVTAQDNRQIQFSPTIQMSSSNNPEEDRRLVDGLVELMKSELIPVMGGGDLSVRLDGSLSDRSSS